MRVATALRPDVPSFGYAVLLSINATSIWGGIFPYLPASVQTPLSTIVFYTVQLAAFCLLFVGEMLTAWYAPRLVRRAHVLACSVPLAAGSLALVGAMYAEAVAFPLVVGAAVLIGVGSAGYLVGWQRVFASRDAARGNLALIKGTGMSAALYFCLCLIPQALTAYLIPLVMVPLAGLCLWISAKESDLDQPMFDDVPREHATVYRNALRESALPALSVGALGFCSGAIRLIAVTHQELLSTINLFGMVALLVVVGVFFTLWRRHTMRIDFMMVLRVLFPVAATFLVVLPFAGRGFATVGSGAAYACFMLACVLMMMHCGQLSRDSGISPVFVYSFYGTIVYGMQMCGYLVGYASGSASALGVEQLAFVGLVALYVLLVAALVGRRVGRLHTDRLEFLMLDAEGAGGAARRAGRGGGDRAGARGLVGARRAGAGASGAAAAADVAAEIAVRSAARASEAASATETAGERAAGGMRSRAAAAAEVRADANGEAGRGGAGRADAGAAEPVPLGGEDVARPITDRLSKRCRQLSELYGLTGRESEVMELIARGHSGPAIAQMLFISENTMRTHNKRIYAKLGIHKKQELLELIDRL